MAPAPSLNPPDATPPAHIAGVIVDAQLRQRADVDLVLAVGQHALGQAVVEAVDALDDQDLVGLEAMQHPFVLWALAAGLEVEDRHQRLVAAGESHHN